MQQFTTDDGESLKVLISGSGPPLILLHEWASSHRVWHGIAQRLESRFTVYRWDARGHGGQRPATPLTVARMADDLAQMLDAFQIVRPLVVGHSMGALTLWKYVIHHGDGNLGKVCIIDQSPKLITDQNWSLGIYGNWPAERDAAFVAAMRADFVTAVLSLIADGLNEAARNRQKSGHPSIARLRAYFASLDPRPLIEVWETLTATDFRPALARLNVPALLIYGAESNYYRPETGPWVQQALSQAELQIYAGADHSPHIGQAERFVADLLAFATAP